MRGEASLITYVSGHLIAATVAAVAVRYFVMHIGIPNATETLVSPNKEYIAWVQTHSEPYFWGGQRDYYEFFILKHEIHADDPSFPWCHEPQRTVIRERVNGIHFPTEDERLSCDIRWAPNDSVVTYDLHGMSVFLSTQNSK